MNNYILFYNIIRPCSDLQTFASNTNFEEIVDMSFNLTPPYYHFPIWTAEVFKTFAKFNNSGLIRSKPYEVSWKTNGLHSIIFSFIYFIYKFRHLKKFEFYEEKT